MFTEWGKCGRDGFVFCNEKQWRDVDKRVETVSFLESVF